MSLRVEIALPQQFGWHTELPIMLQHINRGNHLANEALIAYLNEARHRFLDHIAVPEWRNDGFSWLNADLAVRYRSEGNYGETLKVEVAIGGLHRCGFDMLYRVSDLATGRDIAHAKTAHIFFEDAAASTASLDDLTRSALQAHIADS